MICNFNSLKMEKKLIEKEIFQFKTLSTLSGHLPVRAPGLCRIVHRSRLDIDIDYSCWDLDIRHFDSHVTASDRNRLLFTS